jgi:hypothetical protein
MPNMYMQEACANMKVHNLTVIETLKHKAAMTWRQHIRHINFTRFSYKECCAYDVMFIYPAVRLPTSPQ